MKRCLRYAGELVTMAAVIVMVVSLAAGARIFRWEPYVWLGALSAWVMIAGWRSHIISNWMAISATWERVGEARREFIDRLLDELNGTQPGQRRKQARP